MDLYSFLQQKQKRDAFESLLRAKIGSLLFITYGKAFNCNVFGQLVNFEMLWVQNVFVLRYADRIPT